MLQPQHKATTRRFLGTITYLAKFCPNLSEVIRPLRDLKHIKQEFLWSEQHSKAATQVDAFEYYLGAHCVNQPYWPQWLEQHPMATSRVQFQLAFSN